MQIIYNYINMYVFYHIQQDIYIYNSYILAKERRYVSCLVSGSLRGPAEQLRPHGGELCGQQQVQGHCGHALEGPIDAGSGYEGAEGGR